MLVIFQIEIFYKKLLIYSIILIKLIYKYLSFEHKSRDAKNEIRTLGGKAS